MARPVACAAATYAGLFPSREPQNTHTESIEFDLRALSGSMLPSAHAGDPKRVSCHGTRRRGSGGGFRRADLLRACLYRCVPNSARTRHRVVDRNGFLSGGWHWGHPDVMAGLLSDEGVPFLEQYRVDLAACLWLPDEEGFDLAPSARSSPD